MGNRPLQGPGIEVSDSDPEFRPQVPWLRSRVGTGDAALFTFALGLSIRSLVCVR